MRAAHHSDLLEVELTARRRAVRQVRRAEVPRGRARQGLPRRRAAAGQPARRDRLVPAAAAARGHRPGPGPRAARRAAARRRPTPSCATPRSWRPRRRRPAPRSPPPSTRSPPPGRSRRVADRAGGVLRLLRPLLTRALPRPRRPGSATWTGWSSAAADGRRRWPTFVADLTLDPPASHRRPRRAAAPGRGLPGAVHRALGQGPGVGRRARHPRRRRRVPVRHGAVQRRPGCRGAAAVLRRRHPGPRRRSIYTPLRMPHHRRARTTSTASPRQPVPHPRGRRRHGRPSAAPYAGAEAAATTAPRVAIPTLGELFG